MLRYRYEKDIEDHMEVHYGEKIDISESRSAVHGSSARDQCSRLRNKGAARRPRGDTGGRHGYKPA